MRTTKALKIKTLSTAAFLLAALAAGCGRPTEETKTAENQTPAPAASPAPAATPAPTVPPHELNPEPRSVIVEEATPAPSPSQADLETRERELAQRQADLDTRKKRLREREQERRQARTPRPPAPKAPAPPEPADRKPDVNDVDVQPAPPGEPAEPADEIPPAEEAQPESVTVPEGTVMEVELVDSVSSATSRVGDTFRVRLSHAVRAEGREAIPAGSEIVGEVTEAVPLRKVGGQAKLSLRFTDLVLPGGTTVPIDATFVRQGKSETGRDAATIGGSAAGGAILGRILSKGNRGKGSVIGAIIGAAAGTIIASRTPGEEVSLPSGTVVDLQLTGDVRVRARR